MTNSDPFIYSSTLGLSFIYTTRVRNPQKRAIFQGIDLSELNRQSEGQQFSTLFLGTETEIRFMLQKTSTLHGIVFLIN